MSIAFRNSLENHHLISIQLQSKLFQRNLTLFLRLQHKLKLSKYQQELSKLKEITIITLKQFESNKKKISSSKTLNLKTTKQTTRVGLRMKTKNQQSKLITTSKTFPIQTAQTLIRIGIKFLMKNSPSSENGRDCSRLSTS